jgi:hypothetical protein
MGALDLMLDGYLYTIDRCDVPKERRSELKRFREKRLEWLSWLYKDIHAIWPTIHTMAWMDVSLRTLTSFVAENEENALANPLLDWALQSGFVATQVLAIRRLMEKTSKRERISLRVLIKDLGRNMDLFTRENYVCFNGLPYDQQSIHSALFEKLATEGERGRLTWLGLEADSKSLHRRFDKLAGVDPAKRKRQDRLPRHVLATVEKWLDDSGADALVEWSHRFLAHAAGPKERARIAYLNLTAGKIAAPTKALARSTEALSLLVHGEGRGWVMPAPEHIDRFDKLDKPVMRPGDEQTGRERWAKYSAEWDQCLDGVEDELVGRASSSETGPVVL